MSQLSICIDKRLDSLSSRSFRPFIFKINDHLRRENEKAYEPQILAVGPYHRNKVHLQMMEEHKLRYLQELLKRRSESSVNRYVLEMDELEEEARKSYAEPIKLDKDKFLEMMILDGCFIIELFCKLENQNLRDANDPIFNISEIMQSAKRDLLLFENQLSLCVLFRLYDMTEYPDQLTPLIPLAINFLNTNFLGLSCTKIPTDNTNHLLGLVHESWCSSAKVSSRQSRGIDTNHKKEMISLKSVTELQEDGIKFVKAEKEEFLEGVTELREPLIKAEEEESQSFSFLDINFENGIMRIPPLQIDDDIEWQLRNLIAYEQYNGEIAKTYMTDYAFFMDRLLNSPKDVKILRHSKIIENWLGDDEVVSTMFNKIANHVQVNPNSFYYEEVLKEVEEYCKHPCHGWMAYLRYNYCNNPWSILSVIAASMLLALTVIQTKACFLIIAIIWAFYLQNKGTIKAYEPEILSVGPYHREKVNLQMMKKHKLLYLHELLKLGNESVDRYVEAMENLEEEAQNC
ncbi:unnamed protein product [Ilex paraguariensis]|uniref:Uncharacterized protein n=1 Tax=Ilex paraguariensis TaxID=185542 RepID=A0ABC8V169_9AQUA